MTQTEILTDATGPKAWEEILHANEEILWRGRPEVSWRPMADGIIAAVVGVIFTTVALAGMWTSGQSNIFGIGFAAAGLWVVYEGLVATPLRHSRTWYTLTNRRAFVATAMPHRPRRLESWDITESLPLRLKPGSPGSVLFVRPSRKTLTRTRGFERIADANDVFLRMQQSQRGDA